MNKLNNEQNKNNNNTYHKTHEKTRRNEIQIVLTHEPAAKHGCDLAILSPVHSNMVWSQVMYQRREDILAL